MVDFDKIYEEFLFVMINIFTFGGFYMILEEKKTSQYKCVKFLKIDFLNQNSNIF